MNSSTVVEIDLNCRVRGNQTFAGLEDVTGPLSVGLPVTVTESTTNVAGVGHITEIDPDRGLVYLSVDWPTIQPVDEMISQVDIVAMTRLERNVRVHNIALSSSFIPPSLIPASNLSAFMITAAAMLADGPLIRHTPATTGPPVHWAAPRRPSWTLNILEEDDDGQPVVPHAVTA